VLILLDFLVPAQFTYEEYCTTFSNLSYTNWRYHTFIFYNKILGNLLGFNKFCRDKNFKCIKENYGQVFIYFYISMKNFYVGF